MPLCWQTSSNSAMNSDPPSTWIALTGNGMWPMTSSKDRLASLAVALLAMVGTDQRLTTSTVVNCWSTTPGSGRKNPYTVSFFQPTEDARGYMTLLRQVVLKTGVPAAIYSDRHSIFYLTPAKEVEALNRGFAISHEYTSLADSSKPVSTVKVGDTVRVKVTVLAPADRNYVVVEDLLPAGLEPVDTRLKSIDPKLKARLDADRIAATRKRKSTVRSSRTSTCCQGL